MTSVVHRAVAGAGIGGTFDLRLWNSPRTAGNADSGEGATDGGGSGRPALTAEGGRR